MSNIDFPDDDRHHCKYRDCLTAAQARIRELEKYDTPEWRALVEAVIRRCAARREVLMARHCCDPLTYARAAQEDQASDDNLCDAARACGLGRHDGQA